MLAVDHAVIAEHYNYGKNEQSRQGAIAPTISGIDMPLIQFSRKPSNYMKAMISEIHTNSR